MSYKAYDGSNAIRLILKTSIDFTSTSPDPVEIIYKKPNDDTEYTWTATVLAADADGKIYYDLLSTETLTNGTWHFRAKLTYSDARVIYTEWVELIVGN